MPPTAALEALQVTQDAVPPPPPPPPPPGDWETGTVLADEEAAFEAEFGDYLCPNHALTLTNASMA